MENFINNQEIGKWVVLTLVIVFFILLFIPKKKADPKQETRNRYSEGYLSAQAFIDNGANPQTLFEEWEQNHWDDDEASEYDRGWMQACLDNGAKNY